MLHIFEKLKDLSFSQLMEVYIEGNRENGEEFWPDLDPSQQLLRAEQDFYQYLREVFFLTEQARYYVWDEGGRYVSALRLEPYRDGMLLEALETAPEYRRKGYAAKLIRAVQEACPGVRIYSHVGKSNTASLKTHESCGFRWTAEYAVYADGSVNSRSYTLCWEGSV